MYPYFRYLLAAMFIFVYTHTLAQHYFIVDDDGRKGISQWQGTKKGRVLKAKYEDIKLFDNGTACLKKEGKWAIHSLNVNGSEEFTQHEYDSVDVIKGYSSGTFVFMILQKGEFRYLARLSHRDIKIIDKPFKEISINNNDIIAGAPGRYELYSLTAPGKPYDIYPQDVVELGTILSFRKMGYFYYYKTSAGNFITRFNDKEQYTRVDSAWEEADDRIFVSKDGKKLRYHGKYNPPRWFDADFDVLDGWANYFVFRKDGYYGLLKKDGTVAVPPSYDKWEFANGRLKAPVDMFLLSSKNDICVFRVKDEKTGCLGKRTVRKESSGYSLFVLADDNLWYLYNHYSGTFGSDAYK